MLPVDAVDLDGQLVQALALGWDGAETDATDWSLDRTDLPLLVRQIGTLTVNYVDDLDYTQFVVNGIPVDPWSVERVDYTGHTTLVAAGWEDVARDSDGKWTSGPGGIGIEATTPPPQTPGQIPMWTPGQVAGQKAAATKKAKAASQKAADKIAKHLEDAIAAKAKTETSTKKDKSEMAMAQVMDSISSGVAAYPTEEMLLYASPPFVDAYLKVALGDSYAKKVPDNYNAIERAQVAMTVANQHQADTTMLTGIGYLANRPAVAVEARRAILRETGERKPTGGPGSGQAVHTYYGEAAINALPKEKQAAILVHHSAGSYTMKQALDLAPDTLAIKAVNVDDSYNKIVSTLTAKGVDPSTIPHSNAGAQYMNYGSTKGLPTSAAATVSKPVTNSATALGKPANWAQMSPGKKAAWTKKYNQGKALGVPYDDDQVLGSGGKPANWASMTPGKKAAWTKKFNLGGVTAVYSNPSAVTHPGSVPLGDHSTHMSGSHSELASDVNKSISHMGKQTYDDDSKRIHKFQDQISKPQSSAWISYTGSGYTNMNQHLKTHGVNSTKSTKVNALRDAIKDHGSPAPKVLYRGKKRLGTAELDLKVGDEYDDVKFGSWTSSKDTAKSFAGLGYGGSTKATFYRLLDSKGVRSAPSTSGETETILPPGVRFRVIGIREFIHDPGSGKIGSHVRLLDVEVVKAPYG